MSERTGAADAATSAPNPVLARKPAAMVRALQPQREMREALNDRQLRLHYQPIVRLDTYEITGVEALVRWEHPTGGILLPDDFLPGVAQTPVMRDITRYVIAQACQDSQRWPTWGISVNVAATDVIHPHFVPDVMAALEVGHLDPHRLTLELTEQSVVQDVARATTHLQQLRDLGIGVALDDFGTGYSSLLYLRELPISQVKIDRMFVGSADQSGEDSAIVEAVVRLARRINLEVIAEGVETPEQAAFVKSTGCPAAQGFLFAKPRQADLLTTGTTPEWRNGHGAPPRRRRASAKGHADADTVTSIRQLLADGASLHTIAAALNRSGSMTAQGARWTAQTVARTVAALPDHDPH